MAENSLICILKAELEMKFKTNIKCGGCIAAVTPVLDAVVGIGNWQVDLSDPLKVLTLPENASLEEIKSKLTAIGYQMETL